MGDPLTFGNLVLDVVDRGLSERDAIAALAEQVSTLTAERDALRAQVDCRDATIATQNGMIVDWATKFRDLTAERDKLKDYVRFVALWCNREDPPNSNRKLTIDERLSVIKHHPVTFSVVNAAIDAALAKLK